MPFYKMTWFAPERRATIHNWGCNFRCRICSYLLMGSDRPGRHGQKPERFLTLPEIEEALRRLKPALVNFMGGEPTTEPGLRDLLRFAKAELGLPTRLGHTNGSHLPIPDLDGANVSLKAWDPTLHLEYTGVPKERVFGNFTAAHRAGMELRANTVLIPGYVDADQAAEIAGFVASHDPSIPLHVNGYMEIPGQPFRSPTPAELEKAAEACRKALERVTCSMHSAEEVRASAARGGMFEVERVL
ncbi:MAG: radical SAM protein [Planctomycetes bacterium]|jgi:pyruvate formate lyase activating enzyme|nr:radical SAM protein [Planctomycetota bacterium]